MKSLNKSHRIYSKSSTKIAELKSPLKGESYIPFFRLYLLSAGGQDVHPTDRQVFIISEVIVSGAIALLPLALASLDD